MYVLQTGGSLEASHAVTASLMLADLEQTRGIRQTILLKWMRSGDRIETACHPASACEYNSL